MRSIVTFCLLVSMFLGCDRPSADTTSAIDYQVVNRPDRSMQDMEEALAVLGLNVHSLAYHAPARHRVELKAATYESGNLLTERADSAIWGSSGENYLNIYVNPDQTREQINVALSFSIRGPDGGASRVGGGQFELNGTATTSGIIDNAVLQEDQWVPVFLFCANTASIRGFDRSRPVAEIVADYDTALVVYCKLGTDK